MTTNNVYQATVIEKNGETMLCFDHEMLVQLGWGEGDEIIWEIQDTAIIVRKAPAVIASDNSYGI